MKRRWSWFAAWAIVGAGWGLGLLGIATIGVFVLPVALVATVVLATRPGAATGLPGVVSGLGLPVLYVAYLNRGGPGTVCTSTPTSQTCSETSNPWLWLGTALVLVAIGVLVWIRRHARASSVAETT